MLRLRYLWLFALLVSLVAANVEAATMDKLWQYQLLNDGFWVIDPSPAIGRLQTSSATQSLQVVFGTAERFLPAAPWGTVGRYLALDAKGQHLWNAPTPDDWSQASPAIADIDGDGRNDVVGASSGKWVLTYDGASGSGKWQFGPHNQFKASPAVVDVHPEPGLETIIANQNFAEPGAGGRVFCISSTGKELWSFIPATADLPQHFTSTPAVADLDGDSQLEVVAISDEGNVYALNAAAGSLKWNYKVQEPGGVFPIGGATFPYSGVVISSPAVASLSGGSIKEIVFGTQGGKLYCLDGTGSLKWTYQTGGPIASSPAVGDVNGDGILETVFGSADGNVYCLDPGGLPVWSFTAGGAVNGSPSLAGKGQSAGQAFRTEWPMFRGNLARTGVYSQISITAAGALSVYVGADDGVLYQLSGVNGAETARFAATAPINGSPAIADMDGDGLLEVVFKDTGLYAFALREADTLPPTSSITYPHYGSSLSGGEIKITGTADDLGSGVKLVEVSVDGGTTWNSAAGTINWSYLWYPSGDGTYTIMSRSTDNAGNLEPSPTPVQVIIDNAAPVASILINNGAEYTSSIDAVLTIDVQDGCVCVTYPCVCPADMEMQFSNDGLGWTAWEQVTGQKLWKLTTGDGLKTVYARFRDRAGNMAKAYDDIILQSSVLKSVITSPKDGEYIKGTSYIIKGVASNLTGVDLERVEISTDGGITWNIAVGTSSWNYDWTLPANGKFNLKSRAVSKSGEIETPGPGVYVVVDNILPSGSMVINNGDESTGSMDVLLTVNAADGGAMCPMIYPWICGQLEMELSNDGMLWTIWEPAVTQKKWQLLPGEGLKTVHVRFRDKAGNLSPTATDSIFLKTDSLDTFIVDYPPNPSGSGSGKFTFTSSTLPATFECALDSSAFTTCSSPYYFTGLADGTHIFAVRAKDALGNVDPTPAKYAWTVSTASIDYPLTVSKGGSGNGTVKSNPPGIELGYNTTSSTALFLSGTLVTLEAAADPFSVFIGWRGACSGIGTCSVAMDDKKLVYAVFSPLRHQSIGPVRKEGLTNSYYSLVKDAVDSEPDGGEATIAMEAVDIKEELLLDKDVAVTLKGGFDPTYSTISGQSVLQGMLTVAWDR